MTEQERTSRETAEGELFRLLVENVKDYANFVVDPHRHILSWSHGAERLLGFTEQEIVGKKCDCFFTPEDARDGVPGATPGGSSPGRGVNLGMACCATSAGLPT